MFIIADLSRLNEFALEPGAGQRIILHALKLRMSKDLIVVGFEIRRPPSELDNNVWDESAFSQYKIFYPRWRGYENLEANPRECSGYLMREVRASASDGDIRLFLDFETCFECTVFPISQ